MEKQFVRFVAEGELSVYEQDIVKRYLGRQGLSTEISVDGIAEQEQSLGYMTYEGLRDSYLTQHYLNHNGKLDTNLWNVLVKESNASKTPYLDTDDGDKRGAIGIGGELLQAFRIAPDAGPDAHVGHGQVAQGYELSLDTLDKLIGMGVLGTFAYIGAQTVRLAGIVIESRRESRGLESVKHEE